MLDRHANTKQRDKKNALLQVSCKVVAPYSFATHILSFFILSVLKSYFWSGLTKTFNQATQESFIMIFTELS